MKRRRIMAARMCVITFAMAAISGCYAALGFEPLKFDDDGDGGGGADTSIDGNALGDGGLQPEARVDAGRCVDGVIHDFCDDFEGVRTVQDLWTQQAGVNLAATAIDGGAFIAELYPSDASPPPTPNVASLYYERPWPAKPSSRPMVTIQFRIRVEVCPDRYPGNVALIFLGGGGTSDPDTISVQLTSPGDGGQCVARIGEIQINDAGAFVDRYSGPIPINVGQWTDVKFEMPAWTNEGNGVPPTASLTVNAVPAPYTLTSFVLNPTFSLYFGLSNSTTAVLHGRVALDDLRVDFRER